MPVLRDLALEFVAEAVGFLQDCCLPCQPQCAPKAGIAIFREIALAAEHARLDDGHIHSAELQELAAMMEASQVARLGEKGQCVDRFDPWNGAQQQPPASDRTKLCRGDTSAHGHSG